MNSVTFTIPTMSCMHCIRTIKNELMDVEGVISVDANLDTKQVTIKFSEPADEQILRGVLSEIHYPPQ